MLENPHEQRADETLGQVDQKLFTREKVANEYNLSSKTVARYLRIQKLNQTLRQMLDDNTLSFIAAVTLSFLKEDEQAYLVDCMVCNSFTVDMKKADILRQYSKKGKLNGESVYKVLSGEANPKPNRTPTVKVDKTVYAKYFKPSQSAKEIEDIVEKALDKYFNE
jgi:ParB family chromosome partitioning protein